MAKDFLAVQSQQWNMAQLYMIRMDRQLTMCNIYSMNQDYSNWYHSLGPLYREVSSKLNEKETTKVEEEYKTLTNLYNKYIIMNRSSGSLLPHGRFHKLLHEFDKLMRFYLDKYKLLTPKTPTAMEEMDEMGG